MMRFVRSICAAVALLASAASAFSQSSILQGGAWTPGHSPMYVGQGQSQPIVQDSGAAGGGGIGLGLAEQLLAVRSPTNTYPAANAGTGPLGSNWCDYDAPTTNPTGYHYLCLSPNAQGGGLLTYGFGGGATALPFAFNINGTTINFSASGSGQTFATVVVPTTNGAPVCFSGTAGLLAPCPGITNAQLATVPAATFKGNPTATATVPVTDFTIPSLPARGAPDAANDKILIYNNSTGAFNYVTPGQVASAATAGVSSLCGITGALNATQNTACLNLFSSSLQGAVPASGGGTTSFLRADATFAVPPTFTSGAPGYVPASGGSGTNFLSADGTFKAVAAQNIPIEAQIRITLTQGTPITTTDVTAAQSLFLEPYNGNFLSIYDGSANWVPLPVASSTYALPVTQAQTCTLNATITVTGCTDTSQLTVGEQVTGTNIPSSDTVATIVSATSFTLTNAATGSGSTSLTFKLPASTNYDVYAINNSGVPKLTLSAAWSNDTTPPTRVLQNGVEVASGATTKRLVGSIRTTTVAGQLSDTHSLRFTSNRYNEQPRPMYANDPASTWTGTVSATFAWRQANGNASNQFEYLACVPRPIWAQSQAELVSTSSISVSVGIGIDSSLSSTAQLQQQASIPASSTNSYQTSATFTGTPGLGHHFVAWLESEPTTGTQTWIGTSTPNTQTSGIYGEIAN